MPRILEASPGTLADYLEICPGTLVWVDFYFPSLTDLEDKTPSGTVLQAQAAMADKDLLVVGLDARSGVGNDLFDGI